MGKVADFNKAFNYLLKNEGGLYEDAATGEVSNFGISLKWLQTIDQEATAETIKSLSEDVASDLYYQHWWLADKVNLIPSDRVATKLFDAMVNCGAATAIKLLQTTINEPIVEPAELVTVDGFIGPQVVRAITEELKIQGGEQDLLDAFAVNLGDHYKKIAQDNPALAKNLPGWEARAEKLPS